MTSNKLSQVSLLDQTSYLFLQLEAILSVVSIILVELTILVLIPPEGVGLDLPKTLHKVFILDLHEHPGNRGIKRRQHLISSVWWSLGTSLINLSPNISLGPLYFKLTPIVCL